MHVSHQRSPGCDDPDQLAGLELFCFGKDMGRVDEVIHHAGRHYLLLDTRHWTFGTRRLVPAEAAGVQIERTDEGAVASTHRLRPEVVRDAPDFDPFRLHDVAYWSSIDRHYGLADDGLVGERGV